MGAWYDSGLFDNADLWIKERPLSKGTLVHYIDTDNNECAGRVKDAGMYMLWVEDLENSERTTFIRYTDLTAVFEC